MRKITLLTILSLIAFSAFSQSKWFVSFSSGYGFGGPMASLKKNMKESKFNQKSPDVSILGLQFGGVQYPRSSSGIPGLIKAGVKLKQNRTLYIEYGVSNSGEIEGYNYTGYDPGGSGLSNLGNKINIKFKVLQFTAGYQFSFSNSRTKLGFGPSLYVFNYIDTYGDEGRHSSFVPGASLMVRLPLGKEKRRIGFDLITELNLAPPAQMKEIQKSQYGFNAAGNNVAFTSTLKEKKVNMVHGMIGLALTVRSKTKNQ